MALLVTNCPHCMTQNSAMTIFGVKTFPLELAHDAGVDAGRNPIFLWDIDVAAACQNCFKPVAALLRAPKPYTRGNYPSAVQDAVKALMGEGSTKSLGYVVQSIWPEAAASPIPTHLPPTVAKAYRSAETNFATKDGEDAAAMLYRRAIDVAIREKHPEVTGMLAPRIAKLAERGLLPPSMKEWADQIRLIGNDGAHEPDGVTMDDLRPMRGFTEAFLRYFITIPFEVALRRGEINEDGEPVIATPAA